jgi:hypothetical protein
MGRPDDGKGGKIKKVEEIDRSVSKMVQSAQDDESLRLKVFFFRSGRGNEPVREWLQSLSPIEKRTLGEDVKTVQFGWPLGMPLCASWNRVCGKFALTCPQGLRGSCLR